MGGSVSYSVFLSSLFSTCLYMRVYWKLLLLRFPTTSNNFHHCNISSITVKKRKAHIFLTNSLGKSSFLIFSSGNKIVKKCKKWILYYKLMVLQWKEVGCIKYLLIEKWFFTPVIGNFCQLLLALRGKRHFETDIVKLSKLFEINYWNWKKQFQ